MKEYAIRWENTVSGNVGTGTKRFEQKEAERLAAELNVEYPEIEHKAVIPVPIKVEPPAAQAV